MGRWVSRSSRRSWPMIHTLSWVCWKTLLLTYTPPSLLSRSSLAPLLLLINTSLTPLYFSLTPPLLLPHYSLTPPPLLVLVILLSILVLTPAHSRSLLCLSVLSHPHVLIHEYLLENDKSPLLPHSTSAAPSLLLRSTLISPSHLFRCLFATYSRSLWIMYLCGFGSEYQHINDVISFLTLSCQ